MFYSSMSAPKGLSTDIVRLISEKNEEVSSSGRVDINILLNRARKVKAKETFTNLLFVGLHIFCYLLLDYFNFLKRFFNYIFPYLGPPPPSGVTQVIF